MIASAGKISIMPREDLSIAYTGRVLRLASREECPIDDLAPQYA
jgi:hypothetical protein